MGAVASGSLTPPPPLPLYSVWLLMFLQTMLCFVMVRTWVLSWGRSSVIGYAVYAIFQRTCVLRDGGGVILQLCAARKLTEPFFVGRSLCSVVLHLAGDSVPLLCAPASICAGSVLRAGAHDDEVSLVHARGPL